MVLAADTMTTMERALVETALAFYYKGGSVQYDSYYLAKGARYYSGILRQTNNREPEEASPDDIHYSVCSAFPHDAYYSAFGMHIVDRQRHEQISHLVSPFAKNHDRDNMTDQQLAYELALFNVTASYVAMGEVWDDTDGKVNPGNMVIGYWGPVKDENGNDTDEFTGTNTTVEAVQAMMRPGDIIASHPKVISEDGSVDENGGHTMMFLGDIFGDGIDYVLHSTGTKYNSDDKKDAAFYDGSGQRIYGYDLLEAPKSWINYSTTNPSSDKKNYSRNGTICVAPYSYLMGSGKSYDVTNVYDFAILRPLNAVTEADLTPSARFRLHHPALGVYKTADVKPYRDVKVGDTITYTVSVDNNTLDTVNKNNIGGHSRYGDFVLKSGYGAVVKDSRSKTYSDLVLTEQLPAGTEFVSSTVTPTQNGDKLTWNVPSVSAGGSVSISYTVRVTGGTQIVSPKGTITASGEGYLGTKELTHEVVAQQLDAAKPAGITASSVTPDATAPRADTDAAEDVYAAMGYKLQLPSAFDLADRLLRTVDSVMDPTTANKTDMMLLEEKDLTSAEDRLLRRMIVPGFVGGKKLFTRDENGVRTNENRLRQLKEEFLQPGDVLVYLNGGRSSTDNLVRQTAWENGAAYVYLGDSRYAHYENGVFTVTDDPILQYYCSSSGTNPTQMTSDVGSNTPPTTGSSRKYSYSKIYHQAFMQDIFFLLRPSRVGLTAQTPTGLPVAAETGGREYPSLSAAIEAAQDGGTVTLLSDVELPKTLTVYKAVTIDLDGHTVTATGDDAKDTLRFYDENAGRSFTMKNGIVDGVVYVGNTSTVRLENMKLMGRDWTYTAGTLERKGSALVKSGSSTVVLNNVSIASPSKELPLQGTKGYVMENDVKLLLPDGVTLPENFTLGEGVMRYDGTALRSLDGQTDPALAETAYRPVTFTASPDVKNETTGKTYASLSEAVKAVAEGDTLRLLRNIHASDSDEIAQSYETDTTKATYGQAKYMIASYRGWTLEMDGYEIRDDVFASGTFLLRDNSSVGGLSLVTIRGGTLYSKAAGLNTGSAVLLENVNIYSSQYAVYMSSSGSAEQTVEIRGGALWGTQELGNSCSAFYGARGKLTLSGGVVLGSDSICPVYLNGTEAILGDAVLFTNPYTYHAYDGSKNILSGSVTVQDGCTFGPAQKYAYVTRDGKVREYVKEVCAVTDGAAEIDGRQFLTAADAISAAKEGDTVTLRRDAALSSCTVAQGVTLSVGQHKLTMEEDAVLTVAGTVTGEPVTCLPEQIVLEETGSYLGVTVPAGVEGTVHPDLHLAGTYTVAADSTVAVTGTLPEGYEGVTVLDAATGEELKTENGAFSLGTLAAKEMTKERSIVLISKAEDAAYVGRTEKMSLRGIAEAALEKIDWQTQVDQGRALVALLDYGAAAQKFFDHEKADLANKNTAPYRQYMTIDPAAARKDSSSVSGIGKNTVLGASCVLGQDLGFKLYFDLPASRQITLDIAWGNVKATGLTAGDLQKNSDGYYFYEPEGFTLKDFETEFSITVYENGVKTAEATDSAAGYMARLYEIGETELADAMLTYALAVKALS